MSCLYILQTPHVISIVCAHSVLLQLLSKSSHQRRLQLCAICHNNELTHLSLSVALSRDSIIIKPVLCFSRNAFQSLFKFNGKNKKNPLVVGFSSLSSLHADYKYAHKTLNCCALVQIFMIVFVESH